MSALGMGDSRKYGLVIASFGWLLAATIGYGQPVANLVVSELQLTVPASFQGPIGNELLLIGDVRQLRVVDGGGRLEGAWPKAVGDWNRLMNATISRKKQERRSMGGVPPDLCGAVLPGVGSRKT